MRVMSPGFEIGFLEHVQEPRAQDAASRQSGKVLHIGGTGCTGMLQDLNLFKRTG